MRHITPPELPRNGLRFTLCSNLPTSSTGNRQDISLMKSLHGPPIHSGRLNCFIIMVPWIVTTLPGENRTIPLISEWPSLTVLHCCSPIMAPSLNTVQKRLMRLCLTMTDSFTSPGKRTDLTDGQSNCWAVACLMTGYDWRVSHFPC